MDKNKDLDKYIAEENLKRQLDLAIEDVTVWVRQYVSLRTGHGDYASHGIILGQDEIAEIKGFADMLVDLVNDSK